MLWQSLESKVETQFSGLQKYVCYNKVLLYQDSFPKYILLLLAGRIFLARGGGGGLWIKKGGDKFWMKPQKETNHGVAQDFWTPKTDLTYLKHIKYIFLNFFMWTLNKTFLATYGLHLMAFSPENPKWGQNPNFTPLSKTIEHENPHPFHFQIFLSLPPPWFYLL